MKLDPGNLPEHSPLGASGAERWMLCPGSVTLGQLYAGEEDPYDDGEFSAPGQAAHEMGERCLKDDTDAWENMQKIAENGIKTDKEMADAVQVYLDAVRMTHPDRNQGNFFVERRFHCPTIHEYFFGMSDCVYIDGTNRTLHVWDYKHGAGIVVDVKRNPQIMYYACGALEDLGLWEHIDHAVLHIVQPRGFSFDGPIREWSVSTENLIEWLEDELVPAMDHALVSRDTQSGEHCRFCPARGRACPQVIDDMAELEGLIAMIEANDGAAEHLKNDQVARFLELLDLAKIVGKAANKTAFNRMQNGQVIPGFQLSPARKNRIWKDNAKAAIKRKLGAKAITKPDLKSPAEIDKLPGGKALTARYAYKPDGGLTVTPDTDSRPSVNRDVKSMFKPQKKGTKK